MQQSWNLNLNRAKIFLARHEPREALNCLEKALSSCSTEESEGLSRILYLCGVAFMKLGHLKESRECWYSAAAVDPEGPASMMLRKRGSDKEQSWHTFKAIQLARYFSAKNSASFFSNEERNQVLEIISLFWEELLNSGILDAIDPSERDCLFREVTIDYGTLKVLPKRSGACTILDFE